MPRAVTRAARIFTEQQISLCRRLRGCFAKLTAKKVLKSDARQVLTVLGAPLRRGHSKGHVEAPVKRSRATQESIVLDRSRKVSLRRTARKPAPMLALRALTVKMTVNFCMAASGRLQINSVESSLTIEWE